MTMQDPNQANPAPLPEPVRRHLGRQLLAAYRELQDAPAYLGDPALPPSFDEPIHRLWMRERARAQGASAVRQALQDLLFASHLKRIQA